ncbi:MAG: DegT/DnrJ/EryC1/StrS family aminotransferase [Nitrospirae bacterium]|nr:DegT/DnrJ/EryC1/StrS family aminotransferase [Nitrospirota bacterium]
MNIQFADLKKQYISIKDEIDTAIKEIIDDCAFIGGEEVERFERAFAEACGSKYCVSVGNGTDALFIAMKLAGIGEGDEVITVANSYFATAEAITMTGARPVFVDCDPDTFNMDVIKLKECLEKKANGRDMRVKAMVPVHLYGRVAEMGQILGLAEKYNLKVIEDCAQAHLAEYEGKKSGSIGDAGCFSFYPSKNLGAFGDAGAIVTNNEELAMRMRMFANHGQASRYDHRCEGVNSRLDGIQAAVLNIKLKYLAKWSDERYKNALLYHKYLGNTDGIVLPEVPLAGSHVFHLFVVRLKNRDNIMLRLKEMGVPTIVHYPIALPNLNVYKHLVCPPGAFPVATAYQDEILSLPMFPELTEEEIKYVAECIKDTLHK